MERLERSLGELRIAHADVAGRARRSCMRETVRRNRVRDGIVYLQVTRGVARRDHAFPPPGTQPSVVVDRAQHRSRRASSELAAEGIAVITVPDNRWERVDIKSVALLPNVLAKQAAREQGATRGLVRRRATAASPRARRSMPGSSPWTARSSPGRRQRHPAGHHPDGRDRRHQGAGAARSRSGRSRSRRPMRRARPSSPRPARSCMPVVRIDGRPVGNGAPGLGRDARCGATSTATPKS